MSKHIKFKRIIEASHDDQLEIISKWYANTKDLHIIERRHFQYESDACNDAVERESFDNGKTFTEGKNVFEENLKIMPNGDEIMLCDFEPNICDAVSGNMVTNGLHRYFTYDHKEAYQTEYYECKKTYSDHCYLVYKRPNGEVKKQLIKYEDGTDYSPDSPRDPEFCNKNQAFFSKISFAQNGDLLFPIGVPVRVCCNMLGLDVNEVFPSCPDLMCGVMLVRGKWDEEKEEYELSFSKPVVISDLQSSRGVCEPCVAELKSGRIVIVFRGSNVVFENWHTRIDPSFPGFKWFIYSDDGGKTFTNPVPWYFDIREVVYSSATISYFFRSNKTGKLYWIGNITDPTKTNGNYPRYPLQICEVDDKYGCLIKDTLTVLDTRQEGESENVEFSNFTLFENRETLNLEVRLAKFGHVEHDENFDWNSRGKWCSESLLYEIEFD